MKANRVLIVIASALVTIVAVTLIALNATHVKKLDSTSPQGVVQAFLDSVFAGDYNTAATYFSDESKCTADDLDRSFIPNQPRIFLSDSMILDTSAQVKIRVEMGNVGLINNSSSEEHVLRLIKHNTTWLLTGIPWPLFDCGVYSK